MSRFKYTKEYTQEISFPLGGIGAGCIGLAGNGRLIDWEIFNRPNKNSLNGMSHFAVKAENNGELIDARILQGDLLGNYIGENDCRGYTGYSGYGWGPKRENLCGMPHFREHTFIGQFPIARIEYGGEKMPGDIALNAWSPFIPGNSKDSSLPCAFFDIEIENTTDKVIDYTVVGALSNPFGLDEARNTYSNNDGIHQLTMSNANLAKDDLSYGDITISTDADDISYQEYWYRGTWCDDLEIYWRDFTSKSRFENRSYTDGKQMSHTECDTGHIAAHIKLSPNEKRNVRFVITWNVPNNHNDWFEDKGFEERIADAGLKNKWKNYYAMQWVDSKASSQYAFDNYNVLYYDTHKFKDTLFDSSMPEVAIEAVSANLATLKSPTCLRLEDGTFYGWEGVGRSFGSCEGSCTHVWNYTQALPFLFPDLERSMRTANYKYCVDDAGGSHFRIMLPLGVEARKEDFRPCADGQFGDVIKAYRDWKISGDTEWLKSLWSTIKQTIEYAWSKDNPDMWDIEETGVLWGRQHHTLDMELFGPNAWLTGYYLAALKAASEMAQECNDNSFGNRCSELFIKGKKWADEQLYNGEYYHQLIDLSDREILRKYDNGSDSMKGGKASDAYWSEELGEIKYQVGEGCELDMTIAQWHANLYGLGEIYNPKQVKSALAAIYKYNYFSSMRDIANPWRIYALNDESGLQICSWPEHVNRPGIPLPYAQEDQGGYTYAAAGGMIQCGLISEGLSVVEAVRNRYDGKKRNPWNEIECGNNYARAMASFSLLLSYSGFKYDMVKKMIGFEPIDNVDTNYLWTLGSAWGTVEFSNHITCKVLSGELELNEFMLNNADTVLKVIVDGVEVEFIVSRDKDAVILKDKITIRKAIELK